MNVTITQAPATEGCVKVSLKSGNVWFSLAKAIELRDRLTSAIDKVKKREKEATRMTDEELLCYLVETANDQTREE